MISLFYGILMLALASGAAKILTRFSPSTMAATIKTGACFAGLILAVLFLLSGRILLALLVAGFGTWAAGWLTVSGTFRMRTGRLIDFDADGRDGTVLLTPFAGRRLNDLDHRQLLDLFKECRSFDPRFSALLEVYLDRRFPRWRQDAERDAHARAQFKAQTGAMTEQEAYEILGLQPGADAEAVRDAYRRLVKRFHPDAGGSAGLASRINQARDVLSRHR